MDSDFTAGNFGVTPFPTTPASPLTSPVSMGTVWLVLGEEGVTCEDVICEGVTCEGGR